jgi:hypothetical protein
MEESNRGAAYPSWTVEEEEEEEEEKTPSSTTQQRNHETLTCFHIIFDYDCTLSVAPDVSSNNRVIIK